MHRPRPRGRRCAAGAAEPCSQRQSILAPPALGIAILSFGIVVYLAGRPGGHFPDAGFVSNRDCRGHVLPFRTGRDPGNRRPLIFLLLAIPPPTRGHRLTMPLQTIASRIRIHALAGGVPVIRDGNLCGCRQPLGLPKCSAFDRFSRSALLPQRSATERSWPRRAVIVAAAVPIAVIVNGLRVAATGFACELWGRAAAADPWHTLTGWLTFAAAMGLLVSTGRLVGRTRAPAGGLYAAVIRP
jgi:exosortase/archaeosortase family protein